MTDTALKKTDTPVVPVAIRPGAYARIIAMRVALFLILGLGAIWLVINFVHSPTQFFNSAFLGLSNGALYALIALGYTLVYGIIELINFAHGDLFMLGTLFSGFLLTTVLGQTGPGGAAWALFILTLVATMAFCGTVNVAIEFLAYRRLRRAPKLAPLITAIGISFVLQQVGLWWNGSIQKDWPSVLPSGGFRIGGVTIDYTLLIVVAVTVPLLLGLTWVVTRTRRGKAMRATAQDQDAARLMGINVNRTISFTFLLGGALAGAAGVMYQQVIGTTRFDLGFQLGLIAFTAAVMGGIGNLTGAVLGGVLIGVIQGLNDGLPFGMGQKWSQTMVFSILILLMVFRPSGLLGRPLAEKV
ncbi:MAG TPA: branched-chain amino acid ABC transporter permease [Actinophytocola sp.]|uniref:branched-chain amino acid ABC transporter permease n=1 Tax=Actinophytocola sp. TaxID=1872138 RepID=UPI002DDD24D1|nr:branched-chain amino acid ABC transporter permease [Actinophytocola sp.]HEV2784301.1 branched-chain amino acid ABC transporter permease [Actinophytocola sp.]